MSLAGPLVPTGNDSPVPTRNEIIKDMIKWFAQNFGIDLAVDAAERIFAKVDTKALYEKWKATQAQRGGASGGASGLVFVLAGLALLAGKRKRGRRR